MFTLTRNTQYYKALSVNIHFLLLGICQSPVPIGSRYELTGDTDTLCVILGMILWTFLGIFP